MIESLIAFISKMSFLYGSDGKQNSLESGKKGGDSCMVLGIFIRGENNFDAKPFLSLFFLLCGC